MDNKIVNDPKSFECCAMKKYKIRLRDCDHSFSHLSFGTDAEDAVNNDKIRYSGYGCDWEVVEVNEVIGEVTHRMVSALKNKLLRDMVSAT